MNQNENQNLQPDRYVEGDEINLIDLFVVILKYRLLIVGVVLFALVVATLSYYYYPQQQFQKALKNQKIEANLSFAYTPVVSLLEMQKQSKQSFLQAPLLLKALQQAGYTNFGYGDEGVLDTNTVDITDPENRSTALFLVRRKLIENKDTDGNEYESEEKVFDVNQSGNEVELLFRNMNEERASAFLNAVFTLSLESFVEKVKPQAESVVSSYERLLAIEDPNQGVQSAIETGKERYDAAKQLLSGEEDIFIKMSEPYIFESRLSLAEFRSSFKIKAVVLVLAAFFLAIFLAFLLNAIHNVRSDEESMEKIRAALGKDTKNSNYSTGGGQAGMRS